MSTETKPETWDKENIVKSIMYACVISCMAGPMSELLGSCPKNRFQLVVGILWLLLNEVFKSKKELYR